MAKEFFWPGCVRLTLPGNATGVDGGIIYPMGTHFISLTRRDLDKMYPHLERRLLDPQIYLAELNPRTCTKKCSYLAGYPWFPTKHYEPFNSDVYNQRDWQRGLKENIHNLWLGSLPNNTEGIQAIVKSCISFQESINCESFILPSPLTVDQTTDYSTELNWLEIGLKVRKEVNDGKQALATIAITDSTFRLIDPWKNDLIDLVIDQVSSRSPDGAYIVIEQSNEDGYYCTHPNTISSLLRLVYGLKTAGLKKIVVAYAGIAGFLSLLAGADIWSAGWYKSERKLKLKDIEDSDGRSYPAYYSHDFASEFHLENDLDKVSGTAILPRIQEKTDASALLLEALNSGQKASKATEWQYSVNRVNAAKEHFATAAINHTAKIANLNKKELLAYGLDWLGNAKDLANEISKLGGLHERTAVNHQATWYNVFKNFVKKVS